MAVNKIYFIKCDIVELLNKTKCKVLSTRLIEHSLL
jgi:hypothetical protein